MHSDRSGQIVVIFLSIRTDADDAGYGEAAAAMESLAAIQPGYRGFESTRDADGLGITLSFWADEASALLWRDHPEHKAIRDAGRDRWYQSYEVIVCEAQRSYAWKRQ
ncbi:MAG: antibiotic biosynthesis monooxygenase [Sphingomonas bacterium]